MTNAENYNIHTRQLQFLSLPNVTIHQQVAHYSGMKHFNKPPLEIKKKSPGI
jgi:hypothetical protein